MTQERGLIVNWLTWPRYTWSITFHVPHALRGLMHFSISSSTAAEPSRAGVSLRRKLCGWSHVSLTHPSHHFKETARGWSLHGGCIFPTGGCRGASELHLLSKFHEPLASLQLLQTKAALALKKEEKHQLLLQDGCVVSFCGATDCVCGASLAIPHIRIWLICKCIPIQV